MTFCKHLSPMACLATSMILLTHCLLCYALAQHYNTSACCNCKREDSKSNMEEVQDSHQLTNRTMFPTILTTAVVFIIIVLWKKLKEMPVNPFNDRFVRRHGALELDRAKREKVLKVGFAPERIPTNLDAIVIGSGMGGLVCAGCMARAGKKVLVLEQHDRAGGSTHTYEEKGFEFDIGVHYVGNMEIGSMNHTLLDVLTDGQLVWEKLDQDFDSIVLREKVRKEFILCAGAGEYERRLLKYFPNEEKAIKKFMQQLFKSEKAIVGYSIMKILPVWLLKFLTKTGLFHYMFSRYDDVTTQCVKKVLDDITDNKELKFVLQYAFGDYGTFPSDAPFLMHGVLMKHFYDGGYYPRGGSSELAYNMIPGILRAGGAVLVRSPVSRITFDNGKANGVCVLRNGTEHLIKAPIVISSAGLYNTYNTLIPKEISQKHGLLQLSNNMDRGMACFQTLVGLKGTTEELGLKRRNHWVYTSVDAESSMREFLALPQDEAANSEIPIAFVSFPSAKDSTWQLRHPGKSVCVIVTFLNWSWFEEWENERVMKRGHVYEDLKTSFQSQIWKTVLEIHPSLEDKVEFMDSGSPLSHKYYLSSPRGDVYGIDHTMKRFRYDLGMKLRPDTGIPGLYLTGQDIFTCGVMGATISGILTSGVVLGRNHFLDLFGLMAKRKLRQLFYKSKA